MKGELVKDRLINDLKAGKEKKGEPDEEAGSSLLCAPPLALPVPRRM